MSLVRSMDERPLELRLRASAGLRRRTVLRLWLPMTPVVILLSPLALLAAPALRLFPATRRLRPFRSVVVFGRILLACSGTTIVLDTSKALISIRIF